MHIEDYFWTYPFSRSSKAVYIFYHIHIGVAKAMVRG